MNISTKYLPIAILLFASSIYASSLKEYYDDGSINYEYNIKDDKKDGRTIEYY